MKERTRCIKCSVKIEYKCPHCHKDISESDAIYSCQDGFDNAFLGLICPECKKEFEVENVMDGEWVFRWYE